MGRSRRRRMGGIFALVFFLAQTMGLIGTPGGPAAFAPGVADAAQSAPWDGSIADKFAGGDGSENNPYQIATAEQLAFLAAAVNAASKDTAGTEFAKRHYKLTADIDLGGTRQWTPIGVGGGDPSLLGTFDGNGHTVKGMRIVSGDYTKWQAGLFGRGGSKDGTAKSVIKNLSLTDFVVSVDANASAQVGGLVGWFSGKEIHNVFVSGTVSASANNTGENHSYVGGIVGWFISDTLSSSSASGNVSAIATNGAEPNADAFAGGLVGNLGANATISSSYASANVSSRSSKGTSGAGGLVGNVNGDAKLHTSYASGSASSYSVSGSSNAGGLGGKVAGGIANSYATGPVEADAAAANTKGVFAGGLVGILEDANLKTSYSWGAVSSGNMNAKLGGLIGRTVNTFNTVNTKATVQSNDWRRDDAPGGINNGLKLGIGEDGRDVNDKKPTDAKSLDVSQFGVASRDYFEKTQGWDFDKVWSYTSLDDKARPHLKAFFGTNMDTISPDLVRLTPNAVTISADETKYVHLVAAGWERSADMTFTPSAYNGVTISQSTASPDVIVLSAGSSPISGTTNVAVKFSVNGKAQQDTSFNLVVDGISLSTDAEMLSISANIGGKTYNWQKQSDGKTWALISGLPYNADLSKVDLSVSVSPGATHTKATGLDLSDDVDITVTAQDGTTTKTYTIVTKRDEPPAIETDILDDDPANAVASLKAQADGSYGVEILVDFVDTFIHPTSIEAANVDAISMSITALRWIGDDGSSRDITRNAATGYKMRMTGTASNKAALATAALSKLTVHKFNDTASYVQSLDMKLSDIPGGVPLDPPYYASADIIGISADIGGDAHEWQQQNGTDTWTLIGLPYDVDISAVDLNVSVYPGASHTKASGADLRGEFEITVTAPDGKTTKKHRVLTERATPPVIEAYIVDDDPSHAAASLDKRPDGSYGVDILVRFADDFDHPTDIEKAYVDAVSMSITGVRWVDDELNSRDITMRTSPQYYALHMIGTAPNEAALGYARLTGLAAHKFDDPATYAQSLDMKLSDIPGEPINNGNSGCATGVGALALLALAPALAILKKSRKTKQKD